MTDSLVSGQRGALLFVRSIADLSSAVRVVNELLARRRADCASSDEVLGIVVGEAVDSSIAAPIDGETRMTSCESFALSRIWSLCWFDLGSLDAHQPASDRRRRLLDDLFLAALADHTASTGDRVFLPVFGCEEAHHEVEADRLGALYPNLTIGRECFVDDPRCGGLVPVVVTELYGRTHPPS